jgi:hypothetical protein
LLKKTLNPYSSQNLKYAGQRMGRNVPNLRYQTVDPVRELAKFSDVSSVVQDQTHQMMNINSVIDLSNSLSQQDLFPLISNKQDHYNSSVDVENTEGLKQSINLEPL